jgi:acetamidase/formamidase
MSVAADFGVTQVVDGNWGVHGVIAKGIFDPAAQ